MTESTTLTDEQMEEMEKICRRAIKAIDDGEEITGDILKSFKVSCEGNLLLIAALRTSTERVKELESIMTTWNQEELDEAEKQAKLTKTLFDQAERVKVLEDVIEAKQSLLDCCIPDPYYEKASDRYYDRLPKHEDALKKAGMLK